MPQSRMNRMKTNFLGVRLTEPIRRKLDYLASATSLSPSEVVRRLIELADPQDLDIELLSNGLRRGSSRRNGDG
jgi:predicted DNA-binding protein